MSVTKKSGKCRRTWTADAAGTCLKHLISRFGDVPQKSGGPFCVLTCQLAASGYRVDRPSQLKPSWLLAAANRLCELRSLKLDRHTHKLHKKASGNYNLAVHVKLGYETIEAGSSTPQTLQLR